VLVRKRSSLSGPLRPWIAPAFGAGLVVAGVAMALGMSSLYGPTLGVAVAMLVLGIGQWRIMHGPPKS
jgi:Flp pilus assembly protein TadB